MKVFVDYLRTEVLSTTLQDTRLETDIVSLSKVHAAGAPEAVVFYCSRITEALLKDAFRKFFGSEPPGRLVDTEKILYNYCLLPQSTYYWVKGLRLLGNEVRHSFRPISLEESNCAVIFNEYIFKWFFCEYPLGQQRTTIFNTEYDASQYTNDPLANLARSLEDCKLDKGKITDLFGPDQEKYISCFSSNLTLPILLIEIVISQGDYLSAHRLVGLLRPFLNNRNGNFKNRYHQLEALLLSREGKLVDALKILEPKYWKQVKDHPERVEDETVGILAGIYKRIWERENTRDFLIRSCKTYRWGWQQSRNTYLGINAATTALWLGHDEEARDVAKTVSSILEERRKSIQEKTFCRFDLNYWDMVTLAESKLILNDPAHAEKLYELAFSIYQDVPENVAVTNQQKSRLVNFLLRDKKTIS